MSNETTTEPVEKRTYAKYGEIPEHIRTLVDLCSAYQRSWPEHPIKVSPQMIKHWQFGRKLKKCKVKGRKIWHPIATAKYGFIWKDCKAWFTEYILPKYTERHTDANGSDVDDIDFDDLAKRKRFEHEEWQRGKDRGEYVHRSVALATGITAVKKLHTMVRAEDERQLPNQRRDKLAEILKAELVKPELADKICGEFLAWDIELGKAVTDRRETAMEQAAKLEIKT